MFGRKKKQSKKKIKKQEVKKPHMSMIPSVFYGAKDPTIYHISSKKKSKSKHANKFIENNVTTAATGPTLFSVLGEKILALWGRKFIRYTLFAILSIVVVLGISWYYLVQAGLFSKSSVVQTKTHIPVSIKKTPVASATSVSSSSSKVLVPPKKPQTILTHPSTTTSTAKINTPTSTPPHPATSTIQFPSQLMGNTVDADSDGLTDQEEKVFGTNPKVWDTDGDGYYDGKEVVNLYNPNGIAPQHIIDAGIVSNYYNSQFGYNVYYPSAWHIGSVDTNGDDVLFSSITGDYIEIRSFSKPTAESFVTWFSTHASDQLFSDLKQETNRFQQKLWIRKDYLVAYIVKSTRVYVMVYHAAPDATVIPFRHVMEMMEESFRISDSGVLPPQQILPKPLQPSTTTSVTTSTQTTTTDIQTTTTVSSSKL